jgi:hypothetical protein
MPSMYHTITLQRVWILLSWNLEICRSHRWPRWLLCPGRFHAVYIAEITWWSICTGPWGIFSHFKLHPSGCTKSSCACIFPLRKYVILVHIVLWIILTWSRIKCLFLNNHIFESLTSWWNLRRFGVPIKIKVSTLD